jgi:RHS repeat-associated protein
LFWFGRQQRCAYRGQILLTRSLYCPDIYKVRPSLFTKGAALRRKFMKLVRLILVLAIIFAGNSFLQAQTAPNFENGWKPYGSYDGSHLDTVNLMNGNLMLHLPLLPGIPQRGSLALNYTAYLSSKDWMVACMPEDTNSGEGCWWTKGGSGISIVRPFDLAIHRTVTKTGSGTGIVSFSAGGYTILTADGASHGLYGTPGTEDAYGEATKYDSTDLTGYHLELSGADINGLLDTFTLTDRRGNFYQGTFPVLTAACEHVQGNRLPAPGHFRPLVDDSPLGVSTCSVVALPSLVVDSNGDQISLEPGITGNLNGDVGYFYPSPGTDTLGRVTPPTADNTLDPGPCSSTHTIAVTAAFNYKAPDGTAHQIKLCSAEVPIQTAFNVVSGSTPVVEAVTGGLFDLHFVPIVNIVLPDGSHWTFDYDSYGELAYVGLPTGGSITYTWTTINFVSCTLGANRTPLSRAVATRTLDDGQGHTSVWTYHWGTASASAITNSVTDPAGNDVIHTFAAQGTPCNLFETSTTEYQGSQSANQVLRTATTLYSSTMIGTGSNTLPGNIFATDVTTTAFPSGKVKKVHKVPDAGPGSGQPIFGNVKKELEYDWGQGTPGALLRETDSTYQWEMNPAYLTAHLLDLPVSVIVKDGSGNRVAETDYTYDESAYLTASAVSTQHVAPPYTVRGNQSTVSHWLNTSNSFISSHTNWYDTGEVFQKSDPLGHTTTLTYDPAYGGGYVTQTCSPQTGSVAHCASGTYDFNTGVLTSLTNENATTQAAGNTQGDSAHTSNYSYDSMFRITSAQAPPDSANGGARAQNTFTFSAPNTFPVSMQRTKSITNALSDSATSFFDGLGRSYKSQHAVPGNIATVDTTFDAAGHPATVSNPYFTTADPTYGTTASVYDAVDRPFQVIKQDGSISSVNYNVAVANPGDCTDTKDEAGKQRRTCSDALGRLVEVDEPNPGAGISTATGNVVINGHEQANPQPVIHGTGWVTIGGAETSTQVCQDAPPPHNTCHTVWDQGGVTITVNGYSESVGYSLNVNTTAALVASSLAGAFHNDAASPVDAVIDPGNSSKINFTSRSQTLGGNYTLTAVAGTNDFGDFGGSSFTVTTSGGNLSGGHDATSSPDAGTVTVTVNGVGYSAAYGASDTDGSGIASRLSSLISAGPYANASAAGSTISLTSKTSGPGGDFSLSAAYTWNSASFVQPSFTIAPSGSGLSGGYIANDLSNNPYTTLYQYDALGNLLRVDQKGTAPSDSTQWRTRTFTYDSLSRLITANNPESGTISYSYDADGNLLQKTSPAPNQTGSATQTVSYCYDALHRVTGKGYGAQSCPLASPVVSYGYDSGANAKGKLVSLTDRAGTASYAYDTLGRLTTETRSIAGISKTTGYSYNLDSSVKTLTYPSGRVVTYTPDSAGRLVSATDGNGTNYVISAGYNPDNSLKTLMNGSTPALNQSFQYTPRLQLCRITTLTSGTFPTSCTDTQNIGNIMDRGYDFHAGNGTPGSGSDNGNVFGITNYRDANRSQAFTYDSLNRLTSAWSSANTGAYSWGENYSIDAWGNLQISPMGSKAHGGNFTLSGNAQNRPTGLAYDAAGNLMSYVSATYTYDPENRLSSTAGMSYTYDASGERVLKSNSSTGAPTKRYWSMGGNTLAEGDGTGNLTAEYIYFGGKRVARIDLPANTVHYYLSDHLGSTSLVASPAGAIEEESDYYPFGTEVTVTGPGVNELKFTGKRRDTESQLDYFGARFYSNGSGRFTSVDPKMTSRQRMLDPQQWNMYQYSRNNPIVNIDPDGRETTIYYRAPKTGGGSSSDFGHIFVHVRNSQTGKGAYFDYYPDDKASVIGKVDQQRLDDHSRLTIQTTPQQEQKMLDAITAKQNDVPKYDASPSKILTNSESTCVTQSDDILKTGGVDISGTTPTQVWHSAFDQYSSGALEPPEQSTGDALPPKDPGYDNPKPGQEYGVDPSGSSGRIDPNAQKNENIRREDKDKAN